MKKNRTPRGISTIGMLIGLAIAVVVIGGGIYLASDVWRTKANSAYDQFAKWTPENIAKDPTGYLNFCEEQTNKAVEKLKANEIAIAQKKAAIASMRDDAQGKVRVGNKALDELKSFYRQTDTTWPVTWMSTSLDQDACKRQIMKFASETKSQSDLLNKLESALTTLSAQAVKVQEARDKAKEQLATIATNREMLKVQQITDELKNNLVAMKAVIETSVVGVASNESGSMSLSDLTAKSAGTVDETEFAKIMAK